MRNFSSFYYYNLQCVSNNVDRFYNTSKVCHSDFELYEKVEGLTSSLHHAPNFKIVNWSMFTMVDKASCRSPIQQAERIHNTQQQLVCSVHADPVSRGWNPQQWRGKQT